MNLTFSYNLKSASAYEYSKQDKMLEIDFAEAHKSSALVNMLPTKPVRSDIINFDQLAVLWSFLQE